MLTRYYNRTSVPGQVKWPPPGVFVFVAYDHCAPTRSFETAMNDTRAPVFVFVFTWELATFSIVFFVYSQLIFANVKRIFFFQSYSTAGSRTS